MVRRRRGVEGAWGRGVERERPGSVGSRERIAGERGVASPKKAERSFPETIADMGFAVKDAVRPLFPRVKCAIILVEL